MVVLTSDMLTILRMIEILEVSPYTRQISYIIKLS